MKNLHGRRATVAIIGSGGALDAPIDALAAELGACAMEAGLRVVTGGLGGVMAAASRGARESPAWVEGRIIGVLPAYDRGTANAYVDIALPTGMQVARNVLVVAAADAVIAVGGGAGTLSEVAIAWQLGRPVIAIDTVGGWSAQVAGAALDHRDSRPIIAASGAHEAVERAIEVIAAGRSDAGPIGSGWKPR